MKKIKTISLSSLRTEEDFGFLKLIVTETANLPKEGEGGSPSEISVLSEGSTPALTASVSTFSSAVDAFDAALKDSASVPSSAIASEADSARDASWRGLNNYLKAMTVHPNEDKRSLAVEMKGLCDKYGDPTSLPQTEESGILHNLLQDFDSYLEDTLSSVGVDAWLDDLREKENAFLEAVAARTEQEASRTVGIVKQTRQSADEAYRSLVDLVNALAVVNGDAPYATFIDHVNVLIDQQKSVLKARATNNAKKKEI